MDTSYIPQKILVAVRKGRRKELIKYIGPSGFSAPSSWNRGWLLLKEAVKFKQLKTVRLLLNNKAPVNNPAAKKFNNSPLHLGVETNNKNIVNLLLAYKAKVDVKNKYGITPLNMALKRGYHEILSLLILKGRMEYDKGDLLMEVIIRNQHKLVSCLLKHGAPVNYISDKSNLTPLQYALNSRLWKIAQLLVKSGADVNELDKEGKTILFYAIKYKKTELFKLILKRGINVNTFYNSGESPLYLALKSDFDDYFEMLMQHGADIYASDKNNITLLYEAVTDLQPNKVKLVLKYRTDYNEDQKNHCFYFLFQTFLEQHKFKILPHHKSKYKETLELLLDHGFSVFSYVKSTIHLICKNTERILNIAVIIESHKLVDNFLQGGGVIDNIWSELEESPLLIACKINDYKIVEMFLKAGAEVNSHSATEAPPILYAIQNTNFKLTKLLLNSQSIYSIADLFYYAVIIDSHKILKFLFELKPDFNIDVIDHEKGSLLNVAAWWGNKSIMKILLDRGISTTTCDLNGDTPLHCACIGGPKACIELLLSYSLDTNQRNNDGFTPLQYYRKHGHEEDSHIFVKHVLKLHYAGFYVYEEDLAYALIYPHDRWLYINEVKSLKENKIGNSSISYYNILHGDIDCLSRYMRNKTVQGDYFSQQFLELFPLYSNLLKLKYRLGQRRRMLLDKGNEVFPLYFANDKMLPHEIINRILCYLSNAELRMFTGLTSGDAVVSLKDIRPYRVHDEEHFFTC